MRQLADDSGAITYARAYDPYGVITSTSGVSQTDYGFTGESYGDSTQLLYLRARYYSGDVGRCISRDIWVGNVNSPLSLNRWNYTNANPVNFVDPTGKVPHHNCVFGGDQFCLLKGIYAGTFLDESHFGAGNPTEFWKNLKRARGKGEKVLPPLQQYSPGFRFSGRYIVNIPSPEPGFYVELTDKFPFPDAGHFDS